MYADITQRCNFRIPLKRDKVYISLTNQKLMDNITEN